MAVISNLIARLRLDSSLFDRNINKSRRHMRSFGNSVTKMHRSMTRLARGALLVAGVGGLGMMIKRTMESIDATAKLSDRLNMATESLVALQHAARITGMESETMNKAMETFVRRMGEVRMGVGQAKLSLEKLGLSANELAASTPTEALKAIADQIKGLETAADKAAAAYYLFGRQGTQMLTLFEQGSKGIEQFQKEAERLGITFSRFDAARVEAANDALTRMRAVFTGIFQKGVIQLAPHIEALADSFVEVSTRGAGVGTNVSNAFRQMSLGAVKFGSMIEGFEAKWKAFEAGAKESTASFYELMDAATNLDRLLKGLGITTWTYKGEAERLRKEASALMDEAGKIAESTYGKRTAVEKYFDTLAKRAADIRGQLEQQTAMKVAVESTGVGASAEEMQEFVKTTRGALESVRHQDYLTRMERIQNLKIWAEENAATLAQVEEANKMLNDEILSLERSRVNAMKVYVAELREDMQNMGLYVSEQLATAAQSIEKSMGTAFYNVIAEGKSMKSALIGFAKDIQQAFIKMAAEIMARQVMFSILSSFMGPASVSALIGHSGGRVGEIAKQRTVPAAAFIGAPRLHHGLAPNERPGIFEVGETILPKGVNIQGVGSQAPNVNIINNTGVPMKQSGRPRVDGKNWVVEIVADNIRRGGQLRTEIQSL